MEIDAYMDEVPEWSSSFEIQHDRTHWRAGHAPTPAIPARQAAEQREKLAHKKKIMQGLGLIRNPVRRIHSENNGAKTVSTTVQRHAGPFGVRTTGITLTRGFHTSFPCKDGVYDLVVPRKRRSVETYEQHQSAATEPSPVARKQLQTSAAAEPVVAAPAPFKDLSRDLFRRNWAQQQPMGPEPAQTAGDLGRLSGAFGHHPHARPAGYLHCAGEAVDTPFKRPKSAAAGSAAVDPAAATVCVGRTGQEQTQYIREAAVAAAGGSSRLMQDITARRISPAAAPAAACKGTGGSCNGGIIAGRADAVNVTSRASSRTGAAAPAAVTDAHMQYGAQYGPRALHHQSSIEDWEVGLTEADYKSPMRGVQWSRSSKSWIATWTLLSSVKGSTQSRSFAARKYGFLEAQKLAVEARQHAESSGEARTWEHKRQNPPGSAPYQHDVPGITLREMADGSVGVLATWHTRGGLRRTRGFSSSKYGVAGAIRLAEEAREQGLAEEEPQVLRVG